MLGDRRSNSLFAAAPSAAPAPATDAAEAGRPRPLIIAASRSGQALARPFGVQPPETAP